MRFSGTIQNVKAFEDTGYYVLKVFVQQRNRTETVIGNVFGLNLEVGQWLCFEGEYVVHPKYGAQIKILHAPLMDTESEFEVFETLCSHGVQKHLLDRVRVHFGKDFLWGLSDSEQIKTVPGLTEGQAEFIHSRWMAITAIFKATEVLGSLGLPNSLILKIWGSFPANELYGILSKNPWELVRVDGVTFQQCDALAKQLKIPPDCPQRVEGAVLFVVRTDKVMGSLFLGTGQVVKGSLELLSDSTKTNIDVGQALQRLHLAGKVVVDRTRPDQAAIYDPWSHRIETDAAQRLVSRIKSAALTPERLASIRTLLIDSEPGEDLRVSLERSIRASAKDGIRYSDAQVQATVNAIVEPVSTLTGGPGTGKTTALKMVVKTCSDLGIRYEIVAPTGIAAKRAQQVTGCPSSTIHRAFGATGTKDNKNDNSTYEGIVGVSTRSNSTGEGSVWGRNPSTPHEADLIIVEETSMVDQHCLYRILQGTRPTTRILFVGDHAQLPSVGAGNVMEDLLTSGVFPVTELREIFRQEDTSGIVIAAHDINHGDVPQFEQIEDDFMVIEQTDQREIVKIVLGLVENLKKTNMSFQVMSPRHGGDTGVTNLNSKIRALVNPKDHTKRELKVGDIDIREGDRSMVFQNNYDLDVFNGDIGKIEAISDDRSLIEFKTYENPPRVVGMKREEARTLLRLAYAVTVHKSQGQEWDVVILPWLDSFGQQLRRNLLYTAITRARKKVFIIGQKSAVAKAILNGSRDVRNTLLSLKLKKYYEETL